MKKLKVAILLWSFAVASDAAEWILIGENVDQDRVFLDMASIQRNGDSVTYWTKTNFSQRRRTGALSTMEQATMNCRRREVIDRYLILFDDVDHGGRQIASGEPRSAWKPIAPDTVRWAEMEFICNARN